MATIAPFRAVRPKPEFSAQVASPPYDTVSLTQARNIADGNPHSFLRVSRAEIELASDVDPYSEAVYQRGADNLHTLIANNILIWEEQPLLGIYRQRQGTHQQTGLVALASIDEYDHEIIKKHELTQPAKESDRIRIIETHESQSGPVLLFFHRHTPFNTWPEPTTSTPPDTQFVADDGVEHTIWSIRDQSAIQRIVEDFRNIKALYIADGHHRSAAASRARTARRNAGTLSSHTHDDGFLAVIFPHDELQIFPYNRVVRDLNGHTPVQFVDALAPHFKLQLTKEPGNPPPSGFDMYIGDQWHRATPIPTQDSPLATSRNPVQSLAVSVLTERVLQPLFGIVDQRSDPRIDFVGGTLGTGHLEDMVNQREWSVAFWLYPTTVEELMAVSDAQDIMPPKSTWFEPKLRDGLFIHMLRDKYLPNPSSG